MQATNKGTAKFQQLAMFAIRMAGFDLARGLDDRRSERDIRLFFYRNLNRINFFKFNLEQKRGRWNALQYILTNMLESSPN